VGIIDCQKQERPSRVSICNLRREVVSVILANKPGTLAEAAGKLGTGGITINHGYTGTEEGSKKQLVVFAVSDPKQGEGF
jgi:hypothetical protein